jgi:excisionase family DNA binding protein
MDTFFNVNQVAFILKVHPLTVRRYIREEKLPAVKAGGNVRIREADLQKFTKTFSVTPKRIQSNLNPITQAKTFSSDDPLLRMEGRGASLGSDK